MKLPLDSIKEFLAYASLVPSDKLDLLPILKYFKVEIIFGECTITKSNGKDFVSFTFNCDEEDAEFLISEVKLKVFASVSNEQHVYISVVDKLITLKDIKNYKQSYTNESYNVLDFPKINEYNDDTCIKFSKSLLNLISIARNYCGTDDLDSKYSSVYINQEHIYSSNGNCLFTNRHLEQINSEIVITKKESEVISKLGFVDFIQSENQNIFRFNNVIFGFTKVDLSSGLPYRQFIDNVQKKNTVKVSVPDLVKFCQAVLSSTSSAVGDKEMKWLNSSCIVSDETANLLFQLEDREEISIVTPVTLEGEKFDFKFNQRLCYQIFKSLPYSEIYISNEVNFNCNAIFNKNDPNFLGFIFKIS
jgi:hypothetical protein